MQNQLGERSGSALVKAVFLRVGERTPAGYALELFEGEQEAVLERAENEEAADATDTIPLNADGSGPDLGAGTMDVVAIRDLMAGGVAEGAPFTGAGLVLYRVLDRGAVGKRWRIARKKAERRWQEMTEAERASEGPPLRTYLEIRAPDLARLPWELLRDGADMLALQKSAPLTRFQATVRAPARERAELRVLLVIGCHPNAERGIAWVDEQRSFLSTVCGQRDAIDFEVFEAFNEARDPAASVTLKGELRDTIRTFRPHVLHFVGHGRSDGGVGALELFDFKENDVVPWTSQEFKNWLQDTPPAVVLLNACRTSTAAADPDASITALASMADAALDAHVGCVISMQHDIDGEAAALFATGFYDALALRQPVDVAVIQGRNRITDKFSYEHRNWALPVCTVGTAPDVLLPPRLDIPPDRLRAIQSHPDIAALLSFVDRRSERRAIIHPPADAPSGHVAFVVSDTKMGKSSLARLVARWRWLMQQRVVYVDFGRETADRAPRDVIEILRHIRGGADESGNDILRPNLYGAFAAFHDAINVILDDKPVGALPATGLDMGHALKRAKVTSPKAWDVVFEAFRAGLKELAKDGPVTLVFDHLTKMGGGVVPDDFSEHIVSRLIQPMHRGEVAGVSVVIAATEDEIANCGLSALRTSSLGVALGKFEFEHWEVLAREFVVRERMDSRFGEEAIQLYSHHLKKKPWTPRWFKRIKEDYDESGNGD